MKKFRKIALSLMLIFTVAMTVKGDLLGKIQTIDNLIQKGKYDKAEQDARKLLNDPNITPQEKASIQTTTTE